MIYTSSPLHRVAKINPIHFRIHLLTFFWSCIWEPGTWAEQRLWGMCRVLILCHNPSTLSSPGLTIILLVLDRFYVQITATLLHDFLLAAPTCPLILLPPYLARYYGSWDPYSFYATFRCSVSLWCFCVI